MKTPLFVIAMLASVVSFNAHAENVGTVSSALTEDCSVNLRVNHIEGGCGGSGASDELLISYSTQIYAGKRYLVSVNVTGDGDFAATEQDNTLVDNSKYGSQNTVYSATDVAVTGWKPVPGMYKAFIMVYNADTRALVCTNQSQVKF